MTVKPPAGRASWSKYWWIGKTSARNNLAYPGEVAARILFLSVILYVLLQLWKVTYAGTGAQRLGGLTVQQMVWYLAMTEAITLSAPRITGEIDEDIRTGVIAVQLVRPLSYPLYRLATALGERTVRFAMNFTVGCVVASLLVGSAGIGVSGILCSLITVPLAALIDFGAALLVGLGAFWMEDTAGVWLIYTRMSMILGGMLIPLELFPAGAQTALRLLPFSAAVYGPARLFVQPDLQLLGQIVLQQTIWIVIFGAACAAVYSAATRRILSHGG